ncbi:huntingtin-interacting protein 1-like isoform X2 [Arctopsyche grandis]|uniref:huntingtin-interacting protein 1-like isoform X2 n=1 Tax=Arctopsyche grandis TaxID=121162 RepID=UPI00406D8BAB
MAAMEKRFQQMNQSINKAVNSIETPVKEKHVRSTIIGTFQEKGAGTFWVVALRLPLQENRIVAWKFCHVLHKVLREGHYNCLQQSLRQRDMLKNLGKLWVHLKEGYGKLIQLYCTLLITKINFHDRNPRFPGNLQITGEELYAIGENDINNYFEMSVEIFDYMDDVLALQGAIYDSLDITRTSSMTSSGQCRLAPLIPCIQDSNQLYDFSVKLLFKLHSMLTADTLAGHRERFLKQFKLQKKFYQTADNMQYFKNLITIPSMPENPPNFLIQSELRTYVPPVVILPPEEPFNPDPEMIANLIDTSDIAMQMSSPDTPSDFVDIGGSHSSHTSDLIVERDNLIDHLQSEISRLRHELQGMVMEHQATLASLNDQVRLLENELKSAKMNFEYERKQNALLKEKSNTPSAPELEKCVLERTKVHEEEKVKALQKFEKLKNAYNVMREEHITLLRQKAEIDKQVNVLKKSSTEQEARMEALQTTVNELTHERAKVSESFSKKSDDAIGEVERTKTELSTLAQKYQTDIDQLKKVIEESKVAVAAQRQESTESATKFNTEKGKLETDLSKISTENEALKKDLADLTEKYDQQNESSKVHIQESQKAIENFNTDICKMQKEKQNLESTLEWCRNEKSNIECDLQDLLQQNSVADENISALTSKCSQLEVDISKEIENVSIAQWSIIRCSIQSASDIIKCTLDEFDNPAISSLQCGPDYFRSLLPLSEDCLTCFEKSLKLFEDDRAPTESLAKDIVKAAHILSAVTIQGVATSNTSKDIVFGERMSLVCKDLAVAVSKCVQYVESLSIKVRLKENIYQNGSTLSSAEHIATIRNLIENIAKLAGGVSGQDDVGASDSVEGELADMDKVIEEAAIRIEEMLRTSRAADSGIKLEVNEKILETCTTLMAAVRELVKKSRLLQAEIVSLGKGTNTAKEFYKRNHQWTEGLISAAKAVALGAKLLFTAADKVVTSNGKLEQVMVASQEIAASTAQLVVASRVRAARGSNRLEALSVASRAVSTATGAVIATAKDCAQLVEESEDLDMSGMSLQARRRLEMESRVRVLELDQALSMERLKLAALRRTNYQEGNNEDVS